MPGWLFDDDTTLLAFLIGGGSVFALIWLCFWVGDAVREDRLRIGAFLDWIGEHTPAQRGRLLRAVEITAPGVVDEGGLTELRNVVVSALRREAKVRDVRAWTWGGPEPFAAVRVDVECGAPGDAFRIARGALVAARRVAPCRMRLR